MAGAHGAFHHFGHGAEVEHAGIGLGVDFFHCGNEGEVHTGLLEQTAVGLFCAGICAEVVGIVELSGVYKHARNHHVVFGAGAGHEREVPGVKGAHGGHKPYGLSFFAKPAKLVGEFADSAYYFHCQIVAVAINKGLRSSCIKPLQNYTIKPKASKKVCRNRGVTRFRHGV